LIGNQNPLGTSKSSLGKNAITQNTNPDDTIINNINEKEINKPKEHH